MESKVKEECPDKDYNLNNNTDRRKAPTSKEHRSPEAEDSRVSPTPGPPGPSSPSNNNTAEPLSPPLADSTRTAALQRLRRFLSALQQFAADSSPDTADRVRQYIHNLVSGSMTVEEFCAGVGDCTMCPLRASVPGFLRALLPPAQAHLHNAARAASTATFSQWSMTVEEFCAGVGDCTMYPLRASVPGFLRALLPPAQAHLHNAARAGKQTLQQYLRSHEHQILETGGDSSDIFGPQPSGISIDTGVKRRISDPLYDPSHPATNGSHEDYQPSIKRSATAGLLLNPPLLYPLPSNATLFDYNPYHTYHTVQSDGGFERRDGGISVRDVSSMNASFTEPRTLGASSGLLKSDDEWKNINTMLNCILSMVEKTKRALAILQTRGLEVDSSNDVKRVANEIMAAAVRQTEERVAEVRRRAEDAVNQVKRTALLELQRAVGAAEAKALELVAAERGKMERLLADRVQGGRSPQGGREGQTSPNAVQQNCCWNCGRKAQETCSGCNSARYCGAFCQHKDWENHHQVCSGRDQKPTPNQTSPPATQTKTSTRSSTPITVSDRHPTSSTERLPLTTERLPLTTERLPLTTERLPLTTERLPLTTERLPLTTDRLPLTTERIQITADRIPLTTENRLSLSTLNSAERMLSQDRVVPTSSERITLASLSTAQGLIGGVGGKK